MSQQTSGGKGGNAPSGPQFDYAAANAGKPAGGDMLSKEQFGAQQGLSGPALDQVYNTYQNQYRGSTGFQDAALAQGQSSQQNVNAQTQQNRPDQTNAFGSTTNWTTGPDGRPMETQSFGGPTAGTVSELQQQLLGANATPLDNGAQARQSAEDAIYGRETARLDPQFQQAQEQMTAGLANQGLDPSSQAGQAQIGNFNRAKNDAYSTALQQAIMGGGQEAQRQQQMDLTAREAPEQQLTGLQSLLAEPGFMGAGAADPTQYLQAALAQYGGSLQKYGIDQAGKNSTMGGLANLGGNLGGAYLRAPVPATVAAAGV